MKELNFDEEKYSKNEVIDELIYNKVVLGQEVYTTFDEVYYDNTNLTLLKSLKDNEVLSKATREEVEKMVPEEMKNEIRNTMMALDPVKGIGFENCCYSTIGADTTLLNTIKRSCFLLYLIQLNREVKFKLKDIVNEDLDNFNIYVSKALILKYTDYEEYAEEVFNDCIEEFEYTEGYQKVKKISDKVFMDLK